MAEAGPDRRRTFVPVVLAGASAGALVAVAGSRPWLALSPARADPLDRLADQGEMPLAAALGLVVLACWGVILVTRGRVRRAVAVLGLLASLGAVATVVTGRIVLPGSWVNPADLPGPESSLGWTGWFWAAAVGAVVSVVATAAAVRFVPAWPEMGGRYDAPGAAGAEATADADDASSLDLWKAMDEGRDPTA